MILRIGLFWIVIVFGCGGVWAQQRGGVSGPPSLDLLRDAFVVAEGGEYFLLGTAGSLDGDGKADFDFNRGVPIWKSSDRKTWESAGWAWDRAADLAKAGGRPKIGVWLDWSAPGERMDGLLAQATTTPQIHKIGSDWFMVCAMNAQNILLQKSTTAKPEGPYEDFAYLTTRGGYPTLFKDDDGTVYLVFAEGWIAPLKPDLKELASAPKPISIARSSPGEGRLLAGDRGVALFKRDGKYHLITARWDVDGDRASHDAVVFVADGLEGPYSQTKTVLKGTGPVSVFRDAQGGWNAVSSNPVAGQPQILPIP